jgi:hypothetical protein
MGNTIKDKWIEKWETQLEELWKASANLDKLELWVREKQRTSILKEIQSLKHKIYVRNFRLKLHASR